MDRRYKAFSLAQSPAQRLRDEWMAGRGSRNSPIPEGPGPVNGHASFSLGGSLGGYKPHIPDTPNL